MERIKAMLSANAVLIIGLMSLGLAVLLFIAVGQSNTIEEANVAQQALEREVASKIGEITTLNQEKEALIKQVAQTAVEYEALLADQKKFVDRLKSTSFTLPDHVTLYLEQNGFASPHILLETLMDHNDLIPVEGVLGGTMRWWPEFSVILDSRFAVGYFEDGHIMGLGLLEYAFEPDGTPVWKVIYTYTD